MASVNKVILIGHLGRDPETRYMPDGAAITNASLATSESYKDKSGEKIEKTEWHRLIFFGKLAEIAAEYLKKGSQVYVEGKLQTRQWDDKDGTKKYATEVIAERMQMLGGKERSEEPRPEKPKQQERKSNTAGGAFDDFEDDIPF